MGEVILGTGILTWPAGERRSDRYGFVFLMMDGETSETSGGDSILNKAALLKAQGRYGSLEARVIRPMKSTHIGDLFRGLYPTTPQAGDVIVLGTGTLVAAEATWGPLVGLEPADGRDTDWLDPPALYRAHEQFVTLVFVPDEGDLPPRDSAAFTEGEKA